FEGIRQAGEFYLNGKLVGRHENGINAFGFDVTDLLVPGENVLAARIDNSWDYKERATGTAFEWNDKNFYANYGGINKNVFLHLAGRVYQTLPLYSNLGTTGTYVYATGFDLPAKAATVTAEAQVKNELTRPQEVSYEVVIEDAADGKAIKTLDGGRRTLPPGQATILKASGRVEGLNFWSWG